ncbi:Protein of unknown function [Pyronema omphalodes CBS 100304]|uniref:Uncharacterized protein n=1 Tax=Pyronema omphalodes (strain CBS 100304) TaxID=1076935 RepID=U4L286_PYROM|nr:Protein of unknown function [Pyronema omphalodes CBS 100304]
MQPPSASCSSRTRIRTASQQMMLYFCFLPVGPYSTGGFPASCFS